MWFEILASWPSEAGVAGHNPWHPSRAGEEPGGLRDPPSREAARKMHAMTQAEVKRFLKAVASSRWAAFFLLLVGTRLRSGEAPARRWRDVDLAVGTLTVRRSVQ